MNKSEQENPTSEVVSSFHLFHLKDFQIMTDPRTNQVEVHLRFKDCIQMTLPTDMDPDHAVGVAMLSQHDIEWLVRALRRQE